MSKYIAHGQSGILLAGNVFDPPKQSVKGVSAGEMVVDLPLLEAARGSAVATTRARREGSSLDDARFRRKKSQRRL